MQLIDLYPVAAVLILSVSKLANSVKKEGEGMDM